MTKRSTLVASAGALALAAIALAGCSGGGSTPTVTKTTTTTKTATVTPTPTSTEEQGTAGSNPDQKGGSSTSLRSGQCITPDLAASATSTGGAAGSAGIDIVLTNTGSASCTLQGWPGLSLVGDGNGTQLGTAATFDRSSPHGTVTLAPGGTAVAAALVAEAGNYPVAKCLPVAADGFRIYPPGETRSLFASYTGLTGCSSKAVGLLTEKALQPGG